MPIWHSCVDHKTRERDVFPVRRVFVLRSTYDLMIPMNEQEHETRNVFVGARMTRQRIFSEME